MKMNISLFFITSLFLLSSCGTGNDENKIEASGNIEATTITVSSQVSGRVLEILKDEGDKIQKGDTIVIIDPIIYELKLQEASSALDAAKAQYNLLFAGARKEEIAQAEELVNQAVINFQSAERDKIRFENLYESRSITKKQLDDATSRFDIAKAQLNSAKESLNKLQNLARPEELKQAEANIQRMSSNVELIQKSLNDCFVTSPANGLIVKRFIEEGENTLPGASLFKTADLSYVDLTIYISTTQLPSVKHGQTAEVNIDGYPDRVYSGIVTYISPEAEFTPKSIQTKDERTKLVFAVKIKIANPEYELKSGMPADAKIIID